MTMLEVLGISAFYGGHQALNEVSLTVSEGETVVILGANGAGKTTLLNTVAGMIRPRAGGSIRYRGSELAAMAPHEIVVRGVALVPEGRRVFGPLTVQENLELGAFVPRARPRRDDNLARVFALFPRLEERRRQIARTMSGGEQQMLAIGRALMSEPSLLLLDEPSLGLSPLMSQELFAALERIGAAGVGVLLVEQNARRSLRLARRAYLLENGHIVGEGEAAALRQDRRVAESYLGL
jgi:branched-chain amino acid transport system ATP-binding protein